MEFGDLHSHSDYSIFDGFAKIDDKIKRAKELGYTALAMTEHGTTTGLMEFYLKCRDSGIKPILGYEGYFTEEPDVKGGDTYHLILLAKNLTGYNNLLRIASYGTRHFYRKPRIGIECLRKYSEGIICSTACVAGVMSSDNWQGIFTDLKEIFRDDFYLEIQPHNFPEQYEYNDFILRVAKESNTKVIVTGDSHYVTPEDTKYHRLWLNLDSESEYYASGDYHMMSKEEMKEGLRLANTDEYFKNVDEVIRKCNVEIPTGGHNYPVFNTKDPDRYIRDRCNIGWFAKGINKLPNSEVYKNQVLHELDVLEQCGYKNYFCIIDDMLQWCKKNGIATGVGRGSVGGSTVAYLMDITDVDPIKYNLIFERFANPERVTDCDIDCDVDSTRREDVINYIREKYGEVYQIRTINYISDKSAVQRAGQALKYAPADIDAISTKITSLDDVTDKRLKEVAERFLGHIQNYGTHASAVVVFPKEVENWCAIEKNKDTLVAAQDYHLLEKQGIMKLDILGLETLNIIKNTLRRIPEKIDLSKIPMDDKLTGMMLRNGYTAGCFQVESAVMTGIIQSINTNKVNDLIDTVALGRPGVLEMGMEKTFAKRRQGKEQITYLHPKLKPILEDTEGVIVYQEQIMQIAQSLCGYSYGKADNIRRVIGRKIIDEMQPVVDEMIEAGVNNGIDRETMVEITENIKEFASYGFNRGHSAAYGITAWRTAYLKAHYPNEYMCSVLDSAKGNKPKVAYYLDHCRKMGMKVLPPDIKNSRMEFSGYGKIIHLGFDSISGVGSTEVPNGEEPIAYINENKRLNKTVLKNLVKAGCFDNYTDKTRWELLEYIDWVKDNRKSKGNFVYSGKQEESYGKMEFDVLGYFFTDVFDEYDTYITNDSTQQIVMITNVKTRTTRKGKPMAFVEALTKREVLKLVMFGEKSQEIKKGNVYIVKLGGDDGNIIREYIEAVKKRAA